MTAIAQDCADLMELETPKKSEYPEQTTPRRSERKRALFPTASPQTSDLGHMSPLGSSPDRYSSAPASPDSASFSPLQKVKGPASPFGRKSTVSSVAVRCSPRKRFSMLLSNALKETSKNSTSPSKITRISCGGVTKLKNQFQEAVDNLQEIVPVDQLEQTLLSVMDDSDCPESPRSEHTPGNKEVHRTSSDILAIQPLTPSKRRSLLASGSGSTTSASPHSPELKPRLSLEGRSKSAGAELPRARTSLFSNNSHSVPMKRSRDDGIYLTARNMKRRKTFGEINAGVRTGIRRPPKVKPKSNPASRKKPGKVKSVWDVGPKSTTKRKSLSPIKLPKMSLLANPVKKSDEEIASLSASASLQVRSKKAIPKDAESEEEDMEKDTPAPDPSNKIFKATAPKARTAVFTLSKNIRIKMHKGRFTRERSPPPPPPSKRRRKLYSLETQIQAIKDFDDKYEDVAAGTRGEVQSILQKLEEDKGISSGPNLPVNSTTSVVGESTNEEKGHLDTTEHSNAVPLQLEKASSAPSSPAKSPESFSEGFLSPLSQLASSTSTLSINVGGDTLQLTQAQVATMTAVPDFVMEEDDLPLCEPLPEEPAESSNITEAKENSTCTSDEQDSTPAKYFPIFDSNFSHQKTQVSPTQAKRKRSLFRAIGNDQYQLDAGQKRFGSTECSTCLFIYQMGEPDDELEHEKYHNALKNLRFWGWKKERVVGEYIKNRVVAVCPGDPKSWWSKALEVLEVVDKDLGFVQGVHCDPDHSMVFMYISDKTVIGCLHAVPLQKAYKMLGVSVDSEGIDCCSAEEYPVKCGVSRIWVHKRHRHSGVASQLMDCMRKNFIYGHVLSIGEIAFSSPTVEGKNFAEHYTGLKDYLVFTQTHT